MKKMNNLITLSKTTLFISLFAFTLQSCERTKESGIVKDKIDNKVYLTPVNDTNNVYRVIDFNQGCHDRTTQNLYLNMNRGDTIEYYNNGATEIIPTYTYEAGGTFSRRTDTGYNIHTINGVGLRDLPDLVKKQKEAEAIKQLQQQYQKDLDQKAK